MSSSESDPLSVFEKYQISEDHVTEKMEIYEKLIIKKDLEFSSKLYDIVYINTTFWQQVYFDWFD